MRRKFLLYGCPELRKRWWGPPDVDPPKLPEGHIWLVVAQAFEADHE